MLADVGLEDNCTLLTTCMVGSVLLQIPPFETDVVRVGYPLYPYLLSL